MAGCTIVGIYTLVVKGDTSKSCKVAEGVTGRAIQDRRQMIERLSYTDATVMAGRAIAVNTHVVKRRISKVGDVMANGAILVVWRGRYVVQELTHTNSVVVTQVAATIDTGMIISASAKGGRCMAVATILVTGRTRIVRIGWHVRIESCGKWFACGSNLRWYRVVIAMACLAVIHDAGMIKDSVSETHGVMAHTTILPVRVRMIWRQSRRVNTGAIVVAGVTRLYRGINQAVVEKTTWHFESNDAMA